MSKAILKQLIIMIFLGSMLFFTGCGMQKQTVWTNDYLVTFYTTPRQVQPGENQVAFRVQDRDYRIMEIESAQLVVRGPDTTPWEEMTLKSGPGRDWRGWITIPSTGKYELMMTFSVLGEETNSAIFLLDVAGQR